MAKRIFIIEPNLLEPSGHPIQYVLALQKLCRDKNIEAYTIPNRNVDSEVRSLLHCAYPIISRTCFQFNIDGLQTFYDDLYELHKTFSFNRNDLIIITSCYCQELKCVAKFWEDLPTSKFPHVVMNFHQLYPPTPVSSTILTSEYQDYWSKQLRKAFVFFIAKQSKVSFWTTFSAGLNKRYSIIAQRPIGQLPFLIAPTYFHSENKKNKDIERVNLGFLGDGRQEKGFLLFLNTINDFFKTNDKLGFIIQNSHPRGYCETELKMMNTLISTLQDRPNIRYIGSHLNPYKFQELFSEVDVVVLPYHPMHYAERASMIFVESVINMKPVIVSNQTWMAKEIESKNASGIFFDYDVYSLKKTTFNLKCAVEEMLANIYWYKKTAREFSTYYQNLHTPEHYIQKINDFCRRRE